MHLYCIKVNINLSHSGLSDRQPTAMYRRRPAGTRLQYLYTIYTYTYIYIYRERERARERERVSRDVPPQARRYAAPL